MDGIIVETPISHSTDDKLNRIELVEQVSDIIRKCDTSESCAIGICGKWGSGKTSFVNMVREKLETDETIIFLDFNPWLYSTQDDLINQLLSSMSFRLSSNIKNKIKKAGKKIAPVLKVVGPIIPDKTISELIDKYANLLSDNESGLSLLDLKCAISQRLSKLDYRLVIVIDDIDRLDPSEIQMVMKMIRSVADFSNVIYLLQYDEKIVAGAFDCDLYSGSEYLQKIVNLSIHLPEVNLNNVASELYQRYLAIVGDSQREEKHEQSVFRDAIMPFISSFRDMNILLNRFKIKYSVSAGNTCPIDLLAITLIEFKDTNVYNWISKERYMLCHSVFDHIIQRSIKNRISNPHNDWTPRKEYENTDLKIEYCTIIESLFSDFNKNRDESTKECRIAEHRISISNCVSNYFLLTPSSLAIKESDVINFLYHATIDEMTAILNKYSKIDFGIEAFMEIVLSKYKVVDDLSNERKKLLSDYALMSFDESSRGKIEYLIRNQNIIGELILNYINEVKDVPIVDYILENTPKNDLYQLTRVMMSLRAIDCFAIPDNPRISIDDKKKIEKTLIDRVMTSYLREEDFFSSNEFIFLILCTGVVDMSKSKKIFDYYVRDSESVLKYLEKVNNERYSIDLFGELIDEKYKTEPKIKEYMHEYFFV